MSEPAAISVEGLGKVFYSPAGVREMLRGRLFGNPVTALSDVSFTVRRGEIVCVMGPNGANGTTTYDSHERPWKTKIPDGTGQPNSNTGVLPGGECSSGVRSECQDFCRPIRRCWSKLGVSL